MTEREARPLIRPPSGAAFSLEGRRAPTGWRRQSRARVPLAEMHDYCTSLRSLTQGRAKFRMKFREYSAVPAELQRKLIGEYNNKAGVPQMT